MKKLLLIILLGLVSCSDNKLQLIDQEIVEGRISATKSIVQRGKYTEYPKIWVQSPTRTLEVKIPLDYDNKWKVGDSCVLIIQKYKEVK